MKYILIFLICILACKSDIYADSHRDSIMTSVTRLMETYPKAHLADIYKAAFQDRFGPGHLISDTVAAINYLKQEILGDMKSGNPDYEPTIYGGHFYRVNLELVKNGVIPYDEFLSAFLRSAEKANGVSIEKWIKDWNEILSVIEEMHLEIPDYDIDREAISNALASGNYARHHSKEFEETYDPHYRLIDREIFEAEILPYINDNYWPCGQRKR